MAKRASSTQSTSEKIEEWRSIEGWEAAYEVSSFGRVRSLDRVIQYRCGCGHGFIDRNLKGKVLKPSLDKWGYSRIALADGPRTATYLNHRLVCVAFNGPSPGPEYEVAHNDGDPKNAAASNLRWATSKENKADQVLHGTKPRGIQCQYAKLNEDQVRQIRAAEHGMIGAIARDFGISREHATTIRQRKLWRHI